MKKSKVMICGGILLASMAVLAGCGNSANNDKSSNSTSHKVAVVRLSPQQKKVDSYLKAYTRDNRSFLKKGSYNVKCNTYDVTLKNPSTVKYLNHFVNNALHVQKEHPSNQKLQSQIEQHQILSDDTNWQHESAKNQTRSIVRFANFGTLIKEVQYINQHSKNKHLALNITNMSKNSTLNRYFREYIRDSYKKFLSENGIKGRQLNNDVQQHNQQEKQQANLKKLRQRDQVQLKKQNPTQWKQNQKLMNNQAQDSQMNPNSKQMRHLSKGSWQSAKTLRKLIKRFLAPKSLKKLMQQKKDSKNQLQSNVIRNQSMDV